MGNRASLRRVISSLLALAVGWSAALVAYLTYSLTAWGYAQDLEAIAFWSALFSLLGWAILVAPILLIAGDRLPHDSVAKSSVLGAVISLVAFGILVASWSGLWQHFLYPAFAMVTGAVAGATYALASQRLSPAPPR